MAVIGKGVTLKGLNQPEWAFTFNLEASITKDDVGKVVAIDPTGDNQVKLAGDGDRIYGRLKTVEIREIEGVNVGTVELKGGIQVSTTGVVAVGDTLEGSATAGVAKTSLTPDQGANVVFEVDATNNTAVIVLR